MVTPRCESEAVRGLRLPLGAPRGMRQSGVSVPRLVERRGDLGGAARAASGSGGAAAASSGAPASGGSNRERRLEIRRAAETEATPVQGQRSLARARAELPGLRWRRLECGRLPQRRRRATAGLGNGSAGTAAQLRSRRTNRARHAGRVEMPSSYERHAKPGRRDADPRRRSPATGRLQHGG